MAGEYQFVAAALQERAGEQLLVVAAPIPDLRIGIGQRDVVDMDERSACETRQHVEKQAIHVGAGHGDMA